MLFGERFDNRRRHFRCGGGVRRIVLIQKQNAHGRICILPASQFRSALFVVSELTYVAQRRYLRKIFEPSHNIFHEHAFTFNNFRLIPDTRLSGESNSLFLAGLQAIRDDRGVVRLTKRQI